MKIELIIIGLTDMKDQYRCISGYDIAKKRYLRPLLKGSRIDSNFVNQVTKKIKMDHKKKNYLYQWDKFLTPKRMKICQAKVPWIK